MTQMRRLLRQSPASAHESFALKAGKNEIEETKKD